MGHLVSKQPWCTIDVNTDTGIIVVREDWLYNWKTQVGARPFTIAERRTFHRTFDRQIWGKWSWKFHPHLVGNGPLVEKFKGRSFTVNFDIRWVLHNPQWSVDVIRVPPGVHFDNSQKCEVDFLTRHVILYSFVFEPYTGENAAGVSRPGFTASTHEFGHTIRNPDEYGLKSPDIADADSIMNTGQQLRERHLLGILVELNKMVPGALFML